MIKHDDICTRPAIIRDQDFYTYLHSRDVVTYQQSIIILYMALGQPRGGGSL